MHVYDIKENKKVKVSISHIGYNEIVNLQNFGFDWKLQTEHEIYKLFVKQSNEVIGLVSFKRIFEELRIELSLLEISSPNVGKTKRYSRIAGILIAFVCKESLFSGFYGFVSLIPKTNLIEHYKIQYGFKQFGRHLVVEFESSENLMNKYLIDEEK